MREAVDRLRQEGIVCQKLETVSLAALGSRKRIDLYLGVDLDRYYCSVWHVRKRSRVVQKEVREWLALHARLEAHTDRTIRKRYVWIEAPLCSKAKALLETEGWKVLVD